MFDAAGSATIPASFLLSSIAAMQAAATTTPGLADSPRGQKRKLQEMQQQQRHQQQQPSVWSAQPAQRPPPRMSRTLDFGSDAEVDVLMRPAKAGAPLSTEHSPQPAASSLLFDGE